MIRSIRTPLAYLLSLLLLAGGFAPAVAQTPAASPVASPVADAPSFESDTCAYDLPEGLGADEVECGWVTAPMYPDGSQTGTVRIPIIKILATTDTPAAEPLLILLGGPGQNMSAVLPLFGDDAPLWRYMLDRQDVILFDQRGMGMSEPSLACDIEQKLRDGAVESDIAVGFGLMNCGKELQARGINPAAFTTTTNAADIDAIRVAMGYDQVDLYGISYGSKLALTAIRDYPDSIRASIIASPLPLEQNVTFDQTAGFDAALKYLWDACAADEECAQANPDPAGSLILAMDRLAASPMTITTMNPINGEEIALTIDDMQFLQILYLGVFVGPIAPSLPYLVTDVANGNSLVLEQVAPLMLTDGGISLGVLFTYFCQDEIAFESLTDTTAELREADIVDPLLSDAWIDLGDQLYPVCSVWKFPSADPIENEPVVSDEPLLILTGSMDPITPPTNGPIIQENFSNSQLVNFTAQGHDPASSAIGCSEDIILGFLNDPTAPVDASCADAEIDFAYPDWYGSPVATPVASPAVSN